MGLKFSDPVFKSWFDNQLAYSIIICASYSMFQFLPELVTWPTGLPPTSWDP